GVMGQVGTLLGDAEVNIQAAQLSQEISGEAAIMVLRVDSPPPELMVAIGTAVGARSIRAIAAE
ncbi:MAG: phosphoglycerate dehydrogenase, partial [Actinomycetota bacterium]|nr:phosphoglycerate dehydrogenase [Actinomycetota bacterium]